VHVRTATADARTRTNAYNVVKLQRNCYEVVTQRSRTLAGALLPLARLSGSRISNRNCQREAHSACAAHYQNVPVISSSSACRMRGCMRHSCAHSSWALACCPHGWPQPLDVRCFGDNVLRIFFLRKVKHLISMLMLAICCLTRVSCSQHLGMANCS